MFTEGQLAGEAAPAAGTSGAAATAQPSAPEDEGDNIDPEFLAALPPEIQAEVLEQQRRERRIRERQRQQQQQAAAAAAQVWCLLVSAQSLACCSFTNLTESTAGLNNSRKAYADCFLCYCSLLENLLVSYQSRLSSPQAVLATFGIELNPVVPLHLV